MLLLFWLTDLLDGLFARMLEASSSFGAELDSIVDSLGGVVVTLYLVVLFPLVFARLLPFLVFAGVLGASYLGLAWWRIRRIGLHFWSTKLLAVATCVFQVQTSLVGFNRVVFWVWMSTFTLTMAELMLAVLLGRPNHQTRTVFDVL